MTDERRARREGKSPMDESIVPDAVSAARAAELSAFECWDMLTVSSLGAVALDDGQGTTFPANYIITSRTLLLRCAGPVADLLTGRDVTFDVRGGRGRRGESVHIAGRAMQLQSSGVVGTSGYVRVTPSVVSGDRQLAPTSF